jgi:hypothetical protein
MKHYKSFPGAVGFDHLHHSPDGHHWDTHSLLSTSVTFSRVCNTMSRATRQADAVLHEKRISQKGISQRVVDTKKYLWRRESRVYTHQARHGKGLTADIRAAVTISGCTTSTTYCRSALPASLLIQKAVRSAEICRVHFTHCTNYFYLY